MTVTRRAAVVVAAIAAAWIGFQLWQPAAAPPDQDPESLAGLSGAFGVSALAYDRLVRMPNAAAYVAFAGDRPARAEEVARQMLQFFADLTGRRIEFGLPPAGAETILIEFASPTRYGEIAARRGVSARGVQDLVENTVCYVSRRRAVVIEEMPFEHIVIPVNFGSVLKERCVRHEMMHAFGFPGHLEIASILDVDLRRELPAVNDLILLRTLYDSRITDDMTRTR